MGLQRFLAGAQVNRWCSFTPQGLGQMYLHLGRTIFPPTFFFLLMKELRGNSNEGCCSLGLMPFDCFYSQGAGPDFELAPNMEWYLSYLWFTSLQKRFYVGGSAFEKTMLTEHLQKIIYESFIVWRTMHLLDSAVLFYLFIFKKQAHVVFFFFLTLLPLPSSLFEMLHPWVQQNVHNQCI